MDSVRAITALPRRYFSMRFVLEEGDGEPITLPISKEASLHIPQDPGLSSTPSPAAPTPELARIDEDLCSTTPDDGAATQPHIPGAQLQKQDSLNEDGRRGKAKGSLNAPETDPYERGKRKQLYRQGRKAHYFYYHSSSDKVISNPPPIPEGREIQENAIYVHFTAPSGDDTESTSRSWYWNGGAWVRVSHGDERQFPHAVLFFSIDNSDRGSWVVDSTLQRARRIHNAQSSTGKT